MAAQRMPQQQHNNSQNASSSPCNIPGSYEQSQVTPSSEHNEQASRPMLGADSRLVPSASISDRNGAQAQAVDPGLENTQVNQSKYSFTSSTASVTDCIGPAHNLFRSDSEHKLDIEDKTLEENEDEQSRDNLGAPRVDDVGVSLLPTFQMVQPARADDTLGRSLSSATSSSQNKGALSGSLHISDGAIGLASSSPAFEKCVLPAASLVSQSLQPYAQRTTERDQVSEQCHQKMHQLLTIMLAGLDMFLSSSSQSLTKMMQLKIGICRRLFL
ncbi:uncharacterized protein LOC112566586 isoform X2 [Pomacea canaliculata]|uniref:uncharacterized protein LOC112566586 isoform X2 n=1 Tax=Pomacea canaliculata TaxID=400727 RepID=UPI000D726B3D|nr:uncharacterized protein LOC112566586 isoform X2 [Pomacea canaliculata]